MTNDIRRLKTYWTLIMFNVNSLNLLIVAIILVNSEIDANTPTIEDHWKLMSNICKDRSAEEKNKVKLYR